MKIAGHDIGDALDKLFEELEGRTRIEAERELSVEMAELDALSNVSWAEPGAVIVTLNEGVPTHALPHVFAVALQRVRQRLDRFPVLRPPLEGESEGGPMLRQALRELVLSAEAEMQIEPLNLDHKWEFEQRHDGLKDILRDPPPEWNTLGHPGNKFMALQYARFAGQHPPEMWEGLRKSVQEKLPAAAENGEGILQMVGQSGWGTLGACLQSLVAAREELAMQDVARIEDPRSGEIY
ncbi:MAG TPA: hypothetical protein QGI71_07300 [Dehalococcoidia bacterium]|jgi:hypothetical protein|nr:hypothetical protein [Dehalococcoidia bacterium]